MKANLLPGALIVPAALVLCGTSASTTSRSRNERLPSDDIDFKVITHRLRAFSRSAPSLGIKYYRGIVNGTTLGHDSVRLSHS